MTEYFTDNLGRELFRRGPSGEERTTPYNSLGKPEAVSVLWDGDEAPTTADPESYNPYLYTDNCPLGRIDPTGEISLNPFSWEITKKAGRLLKKGYSGLVRGISSMASSIGRTARNAVRFVVRTASSVARTGVKAARAAGRRAWKEMKAAGRGVSRFAGRVWRRVKTAGREIQKRLSEIPGATEIAGWIWIPMLIAAAAFIITVEYIVIMEFLKPPPPMIAYDVTKVLRDHNIEMSWMDIENNPDNYSKAACEAWRRANKAKVKIEDLQRSLRKNPDDIEKESLANELEKTIKEYEKCLKEMQREVENPDEPSDWWKE